MKLTPVRFNNQTTTLNGKGERGGKLPEKIPVHLSREHGAYVSCWKLGRLKTMNGKQRRMALKDRFMFLLGLRPIWMVVYAKGHPPVYLTCDKEDGVFTKEEIDY